MNKQFSTNENIAEILEKKESIEFFQKFQGVRTGKITEIEAPGDLTKLITNSIMNYSKIYPYLEEVYTIEYPGVIKIMKDITAAEFKKDGEILNSENYEAKTEGDVEVTFEYENGHKVAKVVFVANSLLEHSVPNTEGNIIRIIAKSIALALDNGMLNGTGGANNQLDGILPNIPEANKVTVDPSSSLIDMLKPINLIDSGEYNDSEIVALVNRNTYYNILMELLLGVNNPGALPKFETCYAMPENQILYADFSKYILMQKGNFRIDKSKHARFPFDETGFKGKMNFDGTPGRPAAFSHVTLQTV